MVGLGWPQKLNSVPVTMLTFPGQSWSSLDLLSERPCPTHPASSEDTQWGCVLWRFRACTAHTLAAATAPRTARSQHLQGFHIGHLLSRAAHTCRVGGGGCGPGSPECRQPRTRSGASGAHSAGPQRVLSCLLTLFSDHAGYLQGLFVKGNKLFIPRAGFYWHEWAARHKGKSSWGLFLTTLSILAFFREMGQVFFPFPLSCSKISGGYTTSIQVLPLGGKSLNFYLLQWQNWARPTVPHLHLLTGWCLLPDRNSSHGQLLCILSASVGALTTSAPPTAGVMSVQRRGCALPAPWWPCPLPFFPLLCRHSRNSPSILHSCVPSCWWFQSIQSKSDLHHRVRQPPAHMGLRLSDFTGFPDAKGDISQWLIIYFLDKSFCCCLCSTGESKLLLSQVQALTGGGCLLRTWIKTHSKRFMVTLLSAPRKEQWRQWLRLHQITLEGNVISVFRIPAYSTHRQAVALAWECLLCFITLRGYFKLFFSFSILICFSQCFTSSVTSLKPVSLK